MAKPKPLTNEDIERILCHAQNEIQVIVGIVDYFARCLPEDLEENEI